MCADIDKGGRDGQQVVVYAVLRTVSRWGAPKAVAILTPSQPPPDITVYGIDMTCDKGYCAAPKTPS
jgi:hypothetical protein